MIFDALIPIDDGIDDDFGGGGFRCGLGRFPRTTLINVPQRFARQGFALARFEAHDAKGKSLGERLLLPHTEVMTGDPTQISSGYGGGGVEEANLPSQTFEVSVVDPDKAERTTFVQGGATASKDGCQLPRAVAVDSTKNVAFVACLGSDKVLGFPIEKGSLAAKPSVTVRVASGPNGVAVDPDGQRAVAFSQFDGVVTVFSTIAQVGSGDVGPEKSEIRLTRPGTLSELAAEGRKLFHSGGDDRIAADGRACASCHPDGRDDAITWATPEGPRRSILLAGRVASEKSFAWSGSSKNLRDHMAKTFDRLDADARRWTRRRPPRRARTPRSPAARPFLPRKRASARRATSGRRSATESSTTSRAGPTATAAGASGRRRCASSAARGRIFTTDATRP